MALPDLRTRKLWVNPESVAVQRSRYYATRGDAEDDEEQEMFDARVVMFDWIASIPTALWIGDWTPWTTDGVSYAPTTAAVDKKLDQAGDALMLWTCYNLPMRDGGEDAYSGGGAPNETVYRKFMDAFAAGIQGRDTVVGLEPDGLAMVGGLSIANQEIRYRCFNHAVDALHAAGARVRIDAGSSGWHSAKTMAPRLVRAGVLRAGGVVTDVSHHQRLTQEQAFVKELEAELGFPIVHWMDACKTGRGPRPDHPCLASQSYWCNTVTAGFGRLPTLKPSKFTYPGCEGIGWFKNPCLSDGRFRGAPEAGEPNDEGTVDLLINANPKPAVTFPGWP